MKLSALQARLEVLQDDINNRIYQDKRVPERLWKAVDKCEADIDKAEGEA